MQAITRYAWQNLKETGLGLSGFSPLRLCFTRTAPRQQVIGPKVKSDARIDLVAVDLFAKA